MNLRNLSKLGLGLALTVFLTGVLWGQIGKATINGTVTDQSGAVIVDVRVTATNIDTGVTYTGISNSVGIYQIHPLPIGNYSLKFEKEGFKSLERPGLKLEVAQVAEVNVQLPIGSSSEHVDVTATTPVLLETETSSVDTPLNSKALADLPFDNTGGRDIMNFVYTNIATTSGNNYSGHVAGSQDVSKNITVDGTNATAGIQGFVQNIGMEAVQEMDVQISGINAEGAATGGGAVLVELKSGTNEIHGSAYYTLHNEALNANTWDNNYWLAQCAPGDSVCRNQYRRPFDRFYDAGFSAGGPIWKNHTFIFGSFERYKNVDLTFSPIGTTVPTQAFLNGDFSALLGAPLQEHDSQGNLVPALDPCTGQQYITGQIYDPSAMYVNGSGVTCNVPFAGNKIPSNRISTIAQSIVDNLYKKYYVPTNQGLVSNFPAFAGNLGQVSEHLDLKFDHNLSHSQRFAVSFNWWTLPRLGTGAGGLWQNGRGSTPGPFFTGWNQNQVDRSIRIQHFYNVTSNVVNSFSLFYNEHHASDSPSTPYNAADVGIAGTNGKNSPSISFGGGINGVTETGIGGSLSDGYVQYNRGVGDEVSWVRGRHSFKFGGDFQARGMNTRQDNGIRSYNFSSNTGAPTDSQVSPFLGFAFANFLLGDVGSAGQTVGYLIHGRRKTMGLFAQDDIKVNRRLTVNASLRWDFNLPFHEIDGKWSSFDLNATNPLWAPITGAWTWPSSGSDSFEKNPDYHEFGPHVGAAFQLRRNIVLRGGYGIFYVPLAFNQFNATPWAQGGGSFGFIGSNQVINLIPDAVAFQWDAGYPGQDVYPARTPTQTYLGQGVVTTSPDALHMGMTQNWNAGIQYMLSRDAVLSLNYLGNHGSSLHDSSPWPYNYSTQGVYSTLLNSPNIWNWIQSPSDAVASGVPYPYPGFQGYAFQAITPYPQTSAQSQQIWLVNSPLSVSSYKALIAEVRTRGAHGLTMDVNYTFSRAQGNATDNGAWNEGYWAQPATQDPYNFKNLTNQVDGWDRTHQLKGYVLYDLPFGRGKKWATGKHALDGYLLGGWTIGAQLSYASGTPMGMVNSSNYYPGWSGVFAVRNPGVSRAHHVTTVNLNWVVNPTGPDPNSVYFNPAAFSDPTYGSFSPEKYTIVDWFRNWGWSNEDVSIVKKFNFGKEDRFQASLRAQFFDAANRHHWGGPNTNITDPRFGHVTDVAGNRTGQLSMRFEW